MGEKVFSSMDLEFHIANNQGLLTKYDLNLCSRPVDFKGYLKKEFNFGPS